jgi:hypothetical protein
MHYLIQAVVFFDSTIGTAIGYRLDDRGFGVRIPIGAGIFSLEWPKTVQGPIRPPIQWVSGALPTG